MQTLSIETTAFVPVDDRAPLYDAMVEHKQYLLRMAYSVLRHAEDSEDAVQAAYMSAWMAWGSFRGQSSLKTWLTTIVMNKALSELRTKRRRTWVSVEDDPSLMAEAEWQMSSGQRTPEQHAIHDETVRRVQEQVKLLPIKTQRVVALRYADEMSVDEVAAASKLSRAAVKAHLYRGCSALRKGVRVASRPGRALMFARA